MIFGRRIEAISVTSLIAFRYECAVFNVGRAIRPLHLVQRKHIEGNTMTCIPCAPSRNPMVAPYEQIIQEATTKLSVFSGPAAVDTTTRASALRNEMQASSKRSTR